MSVSRPAILAPGTCVGTHYIVGDVARFAEDRTYYRARDIREEGTEYLILVRWNRDGNALAEELHKKNLRHPGLVTPASLWREHDLLFCAVKWQGSRLFLDEASPLPHDKLLSTAQRLVGLLAFFRRHGVQIDRLSPAHLITDARGETRIIEPPIRALHDGPEATGAQPLVDTAELLRRFCHVESSDLSLLLDAIRCGDLREIAGVGRRLELCFEGPGRGAAGAPIAGMSDLGLTRTLNEDSWGWMKLSDRAHLYVVADGMGGHEGGEVASALAVHTICEVARAREREAAPGLDAVENLLDEAFQSANNTIKDEADERGSDMGTTLVAALVLDQRVAFIANVGDSRAYLLRAGGLHQVSRDHSLVAKMVERGRITPNEARNHPQSNILLRTVGTEHDVEIDLFRVDLEPGDRLLLCSDGLWGEVEDADMERLISANVDPRVAVRELVRAAHQGGAKDNVTAVLVGIP